MRFTRSHIRLPAAILGALFVCSVAGAKPASTKISYLSGGQVYVDAGQLDGVLKGDTLRVAGAAEVAAMLRVTYTSSHRAACDTLWASRTLAIGDVVRYESHAVAAPPPGSPLAKAARRTGPKLVRGRVGANWLSVNSGDGTSFKQPGADFRLDGNGVASGHMDLSLDMRTRQTSRNFGGVQSSDQLSRVYKASVTVRSVNSHQRFTVGRQSSPTLASINLFDGALFELGDERHSIGLFSGTQPDPEKMGFSPDIIQSGIYGEWHQAPQQLRRWSVAFGGVSSQQGGSPNRDFMFGQTYFFSKGLNLSLTQEMDINRGWKRSLGEPILSATSTFGMIRVPLNDLLSFTGGYDNRRSVRLYRDHLTPETQFDDQYREGAWVGGQVSAWNHFRFSGETRGSSGSDRSHTWSSSGEMFRLTPLHIALRARASRFYGSTIDSRLASYGFGFDPGTLSHIEAAGGVRRTTGASGSADVEYWQSVDIDLSLFRRWYLNAGWERDYGGTSGNTRQLQGGLSWRF